MVLAQHGDEFVLQQRPVEKALRSVGERADREIEPARDRAGQRRRACRWTTLRHDLSCRASPCRPPAARRGRTRHSCRPAIRKCRPSVAGSNRDGSNDRCRVSIASRTGKASCSAHGVGTMPRGLRMNRSSFIMWRSRASAWLIAGWQSPSSRPARVTLPSRMTASNTTSRFRSIAPSLTPPPRDAPHPRPPRPAPPDRHTYA